MEHEHYEHKMQIVSRPAVASAKKLCLVVLVIAGVMSFYYLQAPPATKALIDQYSTWPCIILGAIVVIAALRAAFSR